MAFILKKQEDKKENLSRDEWFERFMIEIGQYKKTDKWIELVWFYIKSSELADRFKDWLKKKV